MKGLKGMRFGLVGALAAALVAAGAFLLVSQVSAVSGTLTLSSPNIGAGQSGNVELTSNVPDPGLGAWTIDVSYNASALTPTDCDPEEGGVCNPNFGPGVVRITGASANGLEGPTSLGTITFQRAAGACTPSPVGATTNVFADATVGDPQPIDVTITGGTVACEAATTAPPATALPTLVPSGSGSGGSSDAWIVVGLAGAGLAALAGYGALRLRSKAA